MFFIIALVIRHAKRMRRIILPSAACVIPPYFSSYLINGADFGKKNYWVLVFSSTFDWNISRSKKNSARYNKHTQFYVLSTAHLITIFANNQLDPQFFFLYLFIPVLYMFRATKWSSSGKWIVSIVGDRVVCRYAYHTVTYIEWHIPEVVMIQLTLLMMRTWLLETCRELE